MNQRICRALWIAPLLVLLLAPIALIGCSSKISDRAVTRIPTPIASQRHHKTSTLFLDARPRPAFDRGHIAGAINLRLGELSYAVKDRRLLGRSPLIVYGENPGSATALALAKRLLEMEYEGVEYYEPGFAGWQSAGLPVERAAQD